MHTCHTFKDKICVFISNNNLISLVNLSQICISTHLVKAPSHPQIDESLVTDLKVILVRKWCLSRHQSGPDWRQLCHERTAALFNCNCTAPIRKTIVLRLHAEGVKSGSKALERRKYIKYMYLNRNRREAANIFFLLNETFDIGKWVKIRIQKIPTMDHNIDPPSLYMYSSSTWTPHAEETMNRGARCMVSLFGW